jgi:hypothetical protein
MNQYIIIIIIIIFLLYKYLSKNKNKSYKTNQNTIYVILRIKDDNLDNTEKFLRSFQKQNLKNKKLVILNDNPKFEKYFIIYCDYNNNTDLYSSNKLDDSKFEVILKDLNLNQNQIVLTVDNDDYFENNDLLSQINLKTIKSFKNSNLKENQPKYYYYQKN